MAQTTDYSTFPYHLRTAVWEITLACCFRCAYCGSSGGKARENELSTAECLDVAKQLSDLGCRRVSMIGGEVFMRKDWPEIVQALTSRNVKVCIITNGFRMTPEIIAELKRVRIESVAVSIDGPERVHDRFRQKGSYARALETLTALSSAGIPVSVITALRADNAPLLPEFFETLKQYPIFAWQIQACSPMGNASKNEVDVRFDAKEVMEFIKRINGTTHFYVGAADNIGYYTLEEPFVRGIEGLTYGGCSAGLTTVGIDSIGNVRGCESMYDPRFNEGNLREKSLLDIWTDPKAFSYNRDFTPDFLTGTCKGCVYGDTCAGGCRSYDFFTTGKLYENPLCALHRSYAASDASEERSDD